MIRTTVARGLFFVRLRVQSDGAWVGQVEHIPGGQKDKFQNQQQLLERLAAMVTGSASDTAASQPVSNDPDAVGGAPPPLLSRDPDDGSAPPDGVR